MFNDAWIVQCFIGALGLLRSWFFDCNNNDSVGL
jgi:hypothetical protein